MNKIQKIRYAIYNNPLLIGALLKDTSIKKGIIYSELNKVLPCKIGIEFELSGDFRSGFIKKYCKDDFNYKPKNSNISIEDPVKIGKNPIDKRITKFYKVFDINIDKYYDDEHLTEVRVCLRDFHQLKGLYLIMQDMVEFCKLHEGGGIHIHVDISMYKLNFKKSKEVQRYIYHRLTDVAKIFPKYTGKYNHREVGIRRKSTWVNISRLNTLEFRIAPLTFNYVDLIKWIHGVVKFRQEVIYYCRLKPNYTPDETVSYDNQDYNSDDLFSADTLVGNIDAPVGTLDNTRSSYVTVHPTTSSAIFNTSTNYSTWQAVSDYHTING